LPFQARDSLFVQIPVSVAILFLQIQEVQPAVLDKLSGLGTRFPVDVRTIVAELFTREVFGSLPLDVNKELVFRPDAQSTRLVATSLGGHDNL
jgi:hypothetical protein